MTLTIHTQEDEQRQLTMTVAVPEDRVKKAMQEKARQLSRQINLPGFRKGKVPYPILVKYLGEEAIRSEAVEDMVQELYKEAITQTEIQPYAPGQFDDMELSPLVLKFTVPLEPVVDLGEYRELHKEVEEVTVTDEAVQEALERVQKRHQIVEPVERPAQVGDVVTLKGTGYLVAENNEESSDSFFEEERIDFVLDASELYYGQPFIDEIIGMSVDETKEFTIQLPDGFLDDGDDETAEEAETATETEEVTTKGESEEPVQGHFTITLLEVKNRTLPELNDDLAKEEGEYETLDELAAALRDDLQKSAEESAKNQMIDEMMDDLQAQATINYPPAAIEMELDGMVEDLKNRVTRSGWQWEDYLKLQGETEKSLRDQWREGATQQVKRSLVLRQFVTNEKLRIKAKELDDVFEKRYGDLDDSLKDSMRRFFSESEAGFSMLGGDLLMEKVADRVRAIRSGTAPDLAALEEEEDEDVSEEE